MLTAMDSAVLFWILVLLSAALFAASLLAFVPIPHGAFRVLDFPRTQIALMATALTLIAVLFLPESGGKYWILTIMVSVIGLQLYKIARFTPLWWRRSADFKGEPSDARAVRLLVCNVRQSNRNFSLVGDLINQHDPDIAVFIETDQRWIDALRETVRKYPHQIEQPLDNAYGMYLVSKLRLHDESVRFLLNEEVPSFDVKVNHDQSGSFRLFTVHPEPPLPFNDTIARDAEIALVGELVRNDYNPVIVSGDLNDVAWSRTTRRFLRISRLLDPREGRGQFNSFHAGFFFLRWPLDHLFHSPHFQLISMRRLQYVGSDHFPMLYELALTDEESGRRHVEPSEPGDHEEATELIEIEKRREHRPTGADWETE